jgi:serine/threonine-protein kinase
VRQPDAVEVEMQSQAGLRLGVSLDLAEELGRGGMGTVHAALDRWLGRRVAVKLLSSMLEHGERIDRRFILEAQLAAQLEHPNIVPFYELLVSRDGAPALVMRLVRGQSMTVYLQACAASREASHSAPHDLQSRLERFLKICDAISYAHSRGVIHRDLKPDNVMLGAHNEVYVMDWGVARVMGDERPDSPDEGVRTSSGVGTRNDEIIGTPSYMAPEQAIALPVTFAADQYALGMMLAEIATLDSPRRGSEREQLNAALLGTEPYIEHRFGEAVAPALVAVIRKATARVPEDRYPSVEALADDVRRFSRDEAVSVLPDPPWLRVWRWAKRRPVVVLAVFTSLISVVAVLTVANLLGRLEAERRAERLSERLSEITAAVGRRARGVDAHFQRVALLVEKLADAAEQTLMHAPERPTRTFAPEELASLDSTTFVDRYGQRVSFQHAALVASPDSDIEELLALQARAGDLQALLEDAAARAAGRGSSLFWSQTERQRIAAAGSPIRWMDLGFEEGMLFVYPGNTFFPKDYDVRQRPWYVEAKRQPRLLWGSPYPDATTGRLLLPCTRAFFAGGGAFRGVAAAHLALDDVLESLDFQDVPGFRGAALIDDHGDIVLSTSARGVDLGKGTHDNRAIERKPFPVAAVRDSASTRRDGRVFESNGLYVFQRLEGNDWSLVVTLDRAVTE